MFLRRPREVAEGSLSKTLQAGEASAQSMYCNLGKCTPFGVCLFGGRIWYSYISGTGSSFSRARVCLRTYEYSYRYEYIILIRSRRARGARRPRRRALASLRSREARRERWPGVRALASVALAHQWHIAYNAVHGAAVTAVALDVGLYMCTHTSHGRRVGRLSHHDRRDRGGATVESCGGPKRHRRRGVWGLWSVQLAPPPPPFSHLTRFDRVRAADRAVRALPSSHDRSIYAGRASYRLRCRGAGATRGQQQPASWVGRRGLRAWRSAPEQQPAASSVCGGWRGELGTRHAVRGVRAAAPARRPVLCLGRNAFSCVPLWARWRRRGTASATTRAAPHAARLPLHDGST